jgi:hypothetical protein
MAALIAVAAQVSPGWKWLAVVFGLVTLDAVWLVVGVTTRMWNPLGLIEGANGKPSSSKFQWFVWLIVIVFAYVVLWVIRAKQGKFGASSEVPVNLLTVLGFSTVTVSAAKGIRVGYAGGAPPVTEDQKSGLLKDDAGYPELAKIQMVAFTFIAVGIFVVTLIHQIAHDPVQTTLPDIDSSLLVLMGLSQGGYLGKKLVAGAQAQA